MKSEELSQLMEQVEAKGIGWEKVEEQLKVSQELLKLWSVSGPVPVTIINGMKKILEADS